MPLTQLKIKSTSPRDKPYKLADAAGLYLEVMPSGARYWRMKYRFDGKEKRIAFGVFPEVTLAEARLKRDEARTALRDRKDPGAQRKASKQAARISQSNSLEATAREWIASREAKWTPRYRENVTRRLQADIFPAIGSRPIDEIKPLELLAVLRAIESRGNTDLPNRVRAVLAAIFQYGIVTARCETNPASDLRGALKAHRVKHQAAVSASELPDLLRKIEAYDSDGGDLQTKLALKLLALTFVRTTELRAAEWSEIDFERAEWRIPPERMKTRTAHVVPLSQQTIELLKQLRAFNGDYRWVFAGRTPQRPMSENTMLFALYRMGYRSRMTGHGFRALASTILNEMKYRPDVIERQLAHVERNKVRAAYHRSEYLEERKTMMQDWANHLESLKDGVRVLPISRAAA